jgi:hypothetical protein
VRMDGVDAPRVKLFSPAGFFFQRGVASSPQPKTFIFIYKIF